MRLVQRRGMQHGRDVLHATAHESPVDDRTDVGGERSGQNIDTNRLAPLRLQRPHQRLAEMAGTAGHQYRHAATTFRVLARVRSCSSGPCDRASAAAAATPDWWSAVPRDRDWRT